MVVMVEGDDPALGYTTYFDDRLLPYVEYNTKIWACPTDTISAYPRSRTIDGNVVDLRRGITMLSANNIGSTTWIGGSRPLSRMDSTGTALFTERQHPLNLAFNTSGSYTHNSDHPTYVHRNRANFAFADGHTAALTERESYGTGASGLMITVAKGVWTPTAGD